MKLAGIPRRLFFISLIFWLHFSIHSIWIEQYWHNLCFQRLAIHTVGRCISLEREANKNFFDTHVTCNFCLFVMYPADSIDDFWIVNYWNKFKFSMDKKCMSRRRRSRLNHNWCVISVDYYLSIFFLWVLSSG